MRTSYTLVGLIAKPKQRPRRGRGAHVYIPTDYTEWKDELRGALATLRPVPTREKVAIAIECHGPSKPRGDLDNLAGGILDAIQPPRAHGDVRAQRALEAATTLQQRLAAAPGSLIADDKQVIDLHIRWVPSKTRQTVIHIEERP